MGSGRFVGGYFFFLDKLQFIILDGDNLCYRLVKDFFFVGVCERVKEVFFSALAGVKTKDK